MPLFRGNVSMVEVKSVDTNPTKLPDTEPLCAGKIDTTTARCFDLLCVGKYEQGSNLKLNIQPADEIPNLVTKDVNGDPIFAESKPMCTIRAPKGHNVWVKVHLETITTNATNYMALGIKKQCEDDYFDILYNATDHEDRYVDVLETDIVELIPLASSTALPTYTAVKAGDTAKITGENAYDFGSVYRVHISLHNSQWLTDQPCGLGNIVNNSWYNYGKIGIGSVTDQDDNVHENQLFAINWTIESNCKLAYSSDGIHWNENSSIRPGRWYMGLTYGNGIWCMPSYTSGTTRSIDGGRNWSGNLLSDTAFCSHFANGIFMLVTRTNPGIVYTSPDAEIWTRTGSIKIGSEYEFGTLIYGDGKWICGSDKGYTCCSKDDGRTWEYLGDELYQIFKDKFGGPGCYLYGGCYVNGYFYVIHRAGEISRSPDGAKWEVVFDIGTLDYNNITYYKNKLWAFDASGKKYAVGLFNPDGTIDSPEN